MAGLDHALVGAVLRAENYQRAKHFYHEVLGLEVEDAPGPTPSGVVHTDPEHGFMIYERPGMSAPRNTTLSFMVDDFDAAAKDLRMHGVKFDDYDMPEIGLKTVDGVLESDGMKSAWFRDSEGNILTISTR